MKYEDLQAGMPIIATETQLYDNSTITWITKGNTYIIRSSTDDDGIYYYIIDDQGNTNMAFEDMDIACEMFLFPKPTKSGDFIKADTDKVRMSLVEPEFVEGVAQILTFGAKKYAPGNWKLLNQNELYRYKDSALRHLYAYLKGELYDPESGMPHLDHIATNIMFLRYFEHQLTKGK